ncbi:MAG: glycosyltransferase [Balneolaceae bacterium]
MEYSPFVSVIIPVLNNARGIRLAVDAVRNQTYPADRVEVIVVDNGSDDETPEVVSQLPVRYLTEESVKSPYAARNRALEVAKGEMIAFTDSDCIPDERWLEHAVRLIQRENADLMGGLVTFEYSSKVTAAERYDSLINLEVKNNVLNRGAAKTSNLIVKKELFDEIGYFLHDVRSGGDVEWTQRATRKGYKIVFGSDVRVKKKARTLIPLLKKLYRIGKGQPAVWKAEGFNRFQILKKVLYDFRPVTPRFIRSLIEYRGQEQVSNSMFSLMWVGWLCRLANGLGCFRGMMNNARSGRTKKS